MQASWGFSLPFSKFLCENIIWKCTLIFPLVLSILHSRSYLKIRVEVRIFVRLLQLCSLLHSIKRICIILVLEQTFTLSDNAVHAGGEAFRDMISACVTILTCQNCNSISFGKRHSDPQWLEVERDNFKEKAWNPTRYCGATGSHTGWGCRRGPCWHVGFKWETSW